MRSRQSTVIVCDIYAPLSVTDKTERKSSRAIGDSNNTMILTYVTKLIN